jgi:hypothetical protein
MGRRRLIWLAAVVVATAGCDIATGLSDLRFDLGAGGSGGAGGGEEACVVTSHQLWAGDGDHAVFDLVVDAAGGVYVVGSSSGTLDVAGTSVVAVDDSDGFLARVSSDAEVSVMALESNQSGALTSVAFASDGRLLLGGEGTNATCEGTSTGGLILLADPDSLEVNACSTVFDLNSGPGTRLDDVQALDDAVWVVGRTQNGAFFDGNNLPGGSFILRLDASLEPGDSAEESDDSTSPGRGAIALPDANRPYIATASLGMSAFNQSLGAPPNDGTAVFVLGSSGLGVNLAAFAQTGGNDNERPQGLALGPADAAILVGAFDTELELSNSPHGVEAAEPPVTKPGGGFVAQWAADGNLEWRQLFDAPDSDDEVHAVVVADDGTVYVTGELGLGHGLDEGDCPSSASGAQLFVASLSAAGELRWLRRFDHSRSVSSSRGRAIGLTPDQTSLWVAAELSGALILGSETVESVDGQDIVVLHMPVE